MTDVLDPPIAAGGDEALPDAELVAVLARVAAGDEGAFAELYDATSAAAFGLALQVTGDRTLAADAVNEAYLHIWRNAPDHAATRVPVTSWIMTLTRLSAVQRARAARAVEPRASIESRESAEEPGAAASLASDTSDVRLRSSAGELIVHTSKLPHEQQIVVALAYFGGHSQAEIAERTGASLATVKARMRDALTLLGPPPLTGPTPA